MITFRVDDMTCGHCVGAITKAVQQVDPAADLQIDLATHRVQIGRSVASAAAFGAAMAEAGYTPAVLDDATAVGAPQPGAKGGCCGGCGCH